MKFLIALSSAIVWGSGQVINKQYIKGLVFFIVQCILVFVELSTGTLAVLTGQADAHFRNAGYFSRGLWGIVTLGEIPRLDSSVLVFDHSVMLMMNGLIAIVLLIIFGIIWIWNIRDAYKSRIAVEQGEGLSSAAYVKKLWENSFEYIMITPGTILVAFVSILPVAFSALVAFTNYNRNTIPPRHIVEWVGFQTFRDMIQIPIWGQSFLRILAWTVIWAFLATGSAYLFGLLQAVLINAKGTRFKYLWRSIFILPWAIPGMVSLLVFRTMFNREGIINRLLLDAGIIESFIPWMSDTIWARTMLVIVNIWLGFPYFMALISGVMTTISPELYEAVEIDGGNGWHKFRFISLPIIFTATAPLIVMSLTHNFNNFGVVYFLTEGGPSNPALQMAGSTDILITWIFSLTLDYRMYNFASAISIMIFMVLAVVSGFTLMRTRAFKEE
ncbi:MAG: sugar ABC transporter permease [Defluviitaleaceae bacterium]|nr:sugar ABC transporter permease [Defluviitaleaceae bacterium]